MKKIKKIYLKTPIDDCPDLSWIGEFSDKPKEGAIDHREKSHEGFRVFQYFNPANPEYADQEYKRMMQIENGDVHFIGVLACANTRISTDGGKTWICHKIETPGIWGIESDSAPTYLESLMAEQYEILTDMLKELGFTDIPKPE